MLLDIPHCSTGVGVTSKLSQRSIPTPATTRLLPISAQEIFKLHFALEHPRYTTVRRNIQRSSPCPWGFVTASKFLMSSPVYLLPHCPNVPQGTNVLGGGDRSSEIGP